MRLKGAILALAEAVTDGCKVGKGVVAAFLYRGRAQEGYDAVPRLELGNGGPSCLDDAGAVGARNTVFRDETNLLTLENKKKKEKGITICELLLYLTWDESER